MSNVFKTALKLMLLAVAFSGVSEFAFARPQSINVTIDGVTYQCNGGSGAGCECSSSFFQNGPDKSWCWTSYRNGVEIDSGCGSSTESGALSACHNKSVSNTRCYR
jgi:hypothetical protein